jgi:DNA-binding MarR family transcriptional regulator
VLDASEMEEIVELLVVLGHWARVDFEHACAADEYVAHEVIFLRALARFGEGRTGSELARLLGWTPGRVSQVAASLVEKGFVTRGRRLAVTERGLHEGVDGSFAFRVVAGRMLGGIDDQARAALLAVLRKAKENISALSREPEDPSRL